jgi:ABC-type sugar transport system, periplasmic component
VFVDIEVDGKVPNEAFRSYGMAYSTKYKTSTLEDSEGNKLSINLEKGSHSISFTISMAPICYIMEEIDVIMSEVNDLALEITKVAGNNADKYRDLKLTRYIPGIEDTLYGYYDRLVELEKSAVKWSDSDKGVAVMSSLLIAAEQLKSLADNPDEIPYRIAELTTSQSSVTHFLATAVDNLITNDLAIDRLWIYQEGAELPKKPGIFKSAWMNIQRFVASFTEQAYSTKNTNKDHIQVWVNRSNQYVQIMQKMIDEYFTPETGIEVDISIMPDQYKLVLSNSSGSTPDVATGINYTVPYELAIRGALVNMMDFDDFKEAAADYEPGFFMTGTVDNGIYSMPETMNFWVMFYRSDIMEKLGIEVPQTIDEVIDILPDLQMRGLNFYYPTAGMILMRNFHGTTPLIVQQGGSLYYPTASEGTALGGEATVNGFTKLTDLFTIYNLPVNIDNFYQHFRNGDMPLGIADYATYNMLTNAAPELASSWDIALAPGTTQEDGTIDRSVCGCAEASVIFKSDDERQKKAWEFVKWWSSAETQATFGQTIQISYGSEYIWPTANMKAFQQLPLETNAKNVIAETAKNVVDVPRVPGTYLLEREMSNTFNDIAVNAQDVRTRIDKAVKSINHEFDRKLEEFGYNDSNGSVIKDYKIPTLETVTRLLGR